MYVYTRPKPHIYMYTWQAVNKTSGEGNVGPDG